ncbi:DNA replication complex GINS protein SLD5-like [Panonychus citri]|uniref:DNA replication complex GINS protein SLD5-like n=1 Tax=Panonychus citri TaxID=50023 RepID=UPI0023079576|nr:DNA replication complex GINS protein SLD5-like [Panonychus citri]
MDETPSSLPDEPSQEISQPEVEMEDEDEETVEKENPFSSPREVYGRLIEVVNNECLVEEMLPFEETVLECILEQMRYMSEGLQRVGSKLGSFVVEQHKIELGRFAFLVNKYYRTRLNKLESRCNEFVRLLRSDTKKAFNLLSPLEIKYLDNYVTSIDTFMDEVILSQMPANLSDFKIGHIPANSSAADNEYVFVRCNEATSVVLEEPDGGGQTIVDMTQDDQYFLPFSSLRSHFQKGSDNLHIM